ncbi:hypothetical protein T492DRAFT_1148678, partial [Pavlovales sp. CCMP2436]
MAATGLRAPLLEEQRQAPESGRWLRWVHLVVFALSTCASGLAWGASAGVLCYHFAWSACLSWLLAWMLGARSTTHRAGFLVDVADAEVAFLLRLARAHGPLLQPGSQAPTATVYVTVFTESFEDVLRPTIEQAMRVVHRYNSVCAPCGCGGGGGAGGGLEGGLDGGSGLGGGLGGGHCGNTPRPPANLLILDDGLQLLPESECSARLRFYHRHAISYVARPPSGEAGFERAGFFKKAGNLNYAHALAKAARTDTAREDERSAWLPSTAAPALLSLAPSNSSS